MDYIVTNDTSGPVYPLPDSNHYVKLFRPRNLHYGDPGTIVSIAGMGEHFHTRHQYLVEVGNITGRDRRNNYSRSHDGDNFDLAYPWADRRSGASDPEGRSTAPYRTSANAGPDAVAGIDYALLYQMLAYIAGLPLCTGVLIGRNVMAALLRYIARANVARLVRVIEYRAHEDHIHVNFRHTKLRGT